MDDTEYAQGGTGGRPPVSLEAHDPPASPERELWRTGGGQAPGTLHYVIVRGIDKGRIKDFPWQRQVVRWGFPTLPFPR